MQSLGNFGKIIIGWSIITAAGIYGFVYTKRTVNRQRFESMQIRDRMRKANLGEYQPVDRFANYGKKESESSQ